MGEELQTLRASEEITEQFPRMSIASRKRKRSPDDEEEEEEEREQEQGGVGGERVESSPPDGSPSEDASKNEREIKAKNEGKENDRNGRPPDDDCCPICFSDFSVPCRANCRHWFCGSCILQYWNYSAASKPCKCPMCSASITKLTPEASLLERKGEEEEVAKVLEGVQRYNRLYVGGIRGLFQKARESPLFIKKIFHQMMDPDRPDYYLHEMRLLAMLLSIFYAATPFDFIPTGGLGVFRLFDYAAIVFVLVIRLVGIFRRRRLMQRVRHLAAAQPFGG